MWLTQPLQIAQLSHLYDTQLTSAFFQGTLRGNNMKHLFYIKTKKLYLF